MLLSRVVLVVDDDPLVLDITASFLEDRGCDIITAPDANEALQKLDANHRIEILITDMNMPGKNGYDLADAAVKMRGRLRVLLLSGGEIDGAPSEAVSASRPQRSDGAHHRPLLTKGGKTPGGDDA